MVLVKFLNCKDLFLLALALMLSACATPPGQLTDADFLIKQVSINSSIDEAHSSLLHGFRQCGSESPGLFAITQYGIPDCLPAAKDKTILCDIYIGNGSKGKTQWVLGRIDLTPQGNSTNATLRVQTYVTNNEKTLEAWTAFLSGKAKEVCP